MPRKKQSRLELPPRLQKALADFSRNAITDLQSVYSAPKGKRLPRKLVSRIETDKAGTDMSFGKAEVVDWNAVIEENLADLQIVARKTGLHEVIQGEPDISKQVDVLVGSANGRGRLDSWHLARHVLIGVLDRERSLQFSDSACEKTCDALAKYLMSVEIEYVAWAPLLGFKMDRGEVGLASQVAIKRISDRVRAQWLERLHFGHPLSLFGQLNARFALTTRVSVPKAIGTAKGQKAGNPVQIAKERFDSCVLCLRLLRSGRVGYPAILMRGPENSPIARYCAQQDIQCIHFGACNYQLRDDEVKQLQRLVRQVLKTRSYWPSEVDHSLRRFCMLYSRVSPNDKIVDIVAACDMLLRTTSQHVASLRGAALASRSGADAWKTREAIRAAYAARHTLVHAKAELKTAKLRGRTVPIKAVVSEAEDALRTAFQAVLFNRDAWKDWPQTLDAQLLAKL